MNKLIAAALACLFASTAALPANPACEAQAAEKKISGLKKYNFMKKCEKDATAAATKDCEEQAAARSLGDFAKDDFIKKCVKGVTGTK